MLECEREGSKMMMESESVIKMFVLNAGGEESERERMKGQDRSMLVAAVLSSMAYMMAMYYFLSFSPLTFLDK